MKKGFLSVIIFFAMASLVSGQEWQPDFETAKTIAAKENQNIILVFQGSDWCTSCIKLEKEIWTNDEFNTLAKGHFVMLKADFPRSKKNALPKEKQEENKKLAELYNTSGYFPFVVVLDKNGKVLGQTGYEKMSPKDYFDHLMSFTK